MDSYLRFGGSHDVVKGEHDGRGNKCVVRRNLPGILASNILLPRRTQLFDSSVSAATSAFHIHPTTSSSSRISLDTFEPLAIFSKIPCSAYKRWSGRIRPTKDQENLVKDETSEYLRSRANLGFGSTPVVSVWRSLCHREAQSCSRRKTYLWLPGVDRRGDEFTLPSPRTSVQYLRLPTYSYGKSFVRVTSFIFAGPATSLKRLMPLPRSPPRLRRVCISFIRHWKASQGRPCSRERCAISTVRGLCADLLDPVTFFVRCFTKPFPAL